MQEACFRDEASRARSISLEEKGSGLGELRSPTFRKAMDTMVGMV